MMHVVDTVYASRFETSIADQKSCVDESGIVGGRLDDEYPAVVFGKAMKFLRSLSISSGGYWIIYFSSSTAN